MENQQSRGVEAGVESQHTSVLAVRDATQCIVSLRCRWPIIHQLVTHRDSPPKTWCAANFGKSSGIVTALSCCCTSSSYAMSLPRECLMWIRINGELIVVLTELFNLNLPIRRISLTVSGLRARFHNSGTSPGLMAIGSWHLSTLFTHAPTPGSVCASLDFYR
jgi:hypothetical protein